MGAIAHVGGGVLREIQFGTPAQRLYPLLLGIIGGVVGVLMAVAGTRPGPVALLAIIGGVLGSLGGAAIGVRWDAQQYFLIVQYPSVFAATNHAGAGLMIGGVLGLLGGALLAAGSRAFGERVRQLFTGMLAGAVAAALLTAHWAGSGMAISSGVGPVLWSESVLVVAAVHLVLGGCAGLLLAIFLPRVGQRR